MSDDLVNANQTIQNMVLDFKKTGSKVEQFKASLKRSLSSSSEESTASAQDEGTPAKRPKRESLDLSYIGSPREMRRLRVDLLEARNNVMMLEKRMQQMHVVRKEMQTLFDNETEGLKRQHEQDRKSIEELEAQLQVIRKREAALKVELSEMKDKYNQLKASTEEQILRLEREQRELKDKVDFATADDNMESFHLKSKIAELKSILEATQEDVDAQKRLVAELENKLTTKTNNTIDLELKEVELQKAKQQIRSLESNKEKYLEYQQLAKTQAYKLAKYPDIVKENEKLKEDFARLKVNLKNKLFLEEEVRDLNSRLVKYKELEKKVADLQAQCDQKQSYLSEWKAVARGFCETTERDEMLPHLLRCAIEKLQQQEMDVMAKRVNFEGELKIAQGEAKLAKAEVEKTKKQIADLKLMSDQKQTLIQRMQKKLLLVSRERDSYRLQLDTYERDLTIVNMTASDGAAPAVNIVKSQKDRIDGLENMVQNYRDLVAKLENDLREAQPQLHADIAPIKQEQIARMQEEVVKLRSENQSLREQRDQLEVKLESMDAGNDTLCGGQVVHLLNNPLSERVKEEAQKLGQLQEENVRLKSKIKKLEEGIETSRLGDVTICPKEVQALKDQIKENEKQTQWLKDYFKKSFQDFRAIVHQLFGYKIDKNSSSNIYKLLNLYAEHEEDVLCFEANENGELNLLENAFSSSLEALIDLHLRHQNSVPVFLSALTLNLFSQKTLTTNF